MRTHVATVALLALFAVAGEAQQTVGPVILNGGTHWPVPNTTFDIPKDLTYKVEWDINKGASKPDAKNDAFEVPARFLNQSAAIGVPRANVQVAIVVHGTAGEELLTNAEYRARKGVDNPNIALLEEMSKAGARIILCGQTAGSRKIARDQILSFVLVAPSAAWAHATLTRQGYTVNPF